LSTYSKSRLTEQLIYNDSDGKQLHSIPTFSSMFTLGVLFIDKFRHLKDIIVKNCLLSIPKW
jgi:hypothetical protein